MIEFQIKMSFNDNHIVPPHRDYAEFLNDNITGKRASCDKQTNKFGTDLISVCKHYMIQICNERVGEYKGQLYLSVLMTIV